MASIKSKLIDRIKSIEDQNVIDEINRLLEVDIDEVVYHTTEEQKEEIDQARKQIANNEGIPSDIADSEIEEWLSK
ncbi:MAG: hypothetical protein R8N23_00780 [Reichenbachiella sp.]|uniref:hypothetical protein n=1 Tax=Reichenbachiella sp. TaxID=2184521 RepID=UPI002966165C|nr:hypothetical protein [Reichenbachiella sp.]MDW3208369.1 hypothetical protein [Reichenbachiella sp.]